MANSPDSSHSNLKDSLVSHMQTRQENGQHLPESSSELTARELPIPNLTKLLRGKGPEWEAIGAKPRPLQLLDLPVDILRLIVKEASLYPSRHFFADCNVSNRHNLGYSYERPYLLSSDELHTLLPDHTTDICSLRYRLAGRHCSSIRQQKCRRANIRVSHTMLGKQVRPTVQMATRKLYRL